MDGRQIAPELPDSAGEILAALSTDVARISEDAKKDPAQFAKDVQNAEELVQHLTQEIRTTSYLLHRSTLDESGISPALRWYPHALAERSSLALAIDLKVPEYSNLGKRVRRISIVTRESKTALIRIEREEKTVPVTVEDQGRGMSPEGLAEIQSHGTGVGIRGMRECLRHFRLAICLSNPTVPVRELSRLSR